MDDRSRYFKETEEFFALMRMGGFVLSHKDLEQVEELYRNGYPLSVVLDGITEGVKTFFHKQGTERRPPHQFSYYRAFIKTAVRRFRVPESGEGPAAAADFVREVELLTLCEAREVEKKLKGGYLEQLRNLLAYGGSPDGDFAALKATILALDAEVLHSYHRVTGGVESDIPGLAGARLSRLREALGLPDPEVFFTLHRN